MTRRSLIAFGICIYLAGFRFKDILCDCQGVATVLNSTSGTVSSPNYPFSYGRPLDCHWLVTVKLGSKISVHFKTPFGIVDLGYDWLNIYDGGSEASNSLYRLGAKESPGSFITSSNELYIVFTSRSDGYSGGNGFSFTYTEYSGTVQSYTEKMSGVIVTKNYPSNYLLGELYTWQISVPKDHKIQLIFTDFTVYNGDWLRVYDGLTENDTLLYWFTLVPDNNAEYSSMPNALLPHHQALITLQTAGPGRCLIHYRGVQDDKCPVLQAPDNGYMSGFDYRVNRSMTFHCNQGYELLGSTRIICVQDDTPNPNWSDSIPICRATSSCGGNYLNAAGGVISSPNYPSPYPSNSDCIWIITNKLTYQIQVEFNEIFSLKNDSDFLEIYDGGTNEAPLLANFTGPLHPDNLLSTRNQLYVRFHSNESVSTGSGFSFKFNVSASEKLRCGDVITGTSGVIETPYFPASLWRMFTCDWTIVVPKGNLVWLKPAGKYKVTDGAYPVFYSGTATNKKFVLRAAGNIEHSLVTTSNELYIEYVTYKYPPTASAGFKLLYEAIPEQQLFRNVSQGSIVSPNYPYTYNKYANMWWNLTTSQDAVFGFHMNGPLKLWTGRHFILFYDEVNGTLELFNNMSTSYGGFYTEMFQSTTNKAVINFITDGSTHFPQSGFIIDYQAFVPTLCVPLRIDNGTVKGSNEVNSTVIFECNYWYKLIGDSTLKCLATDENTTIPHWNATLPYCSKDACSSMKIQQNSTFGFIISPGYPVSYHHGAYKCSNYYTAPSKEYHIAIRAVFMDPNPSIYNKVKRSCPSFGWDSYVLFSAANITYPGICAHDSIQFFVDTTYNDINVGFQMVYQAYIPGLTTAAILDSTTCFDPGVPDMLTREVDGNFSVGTVLRYNCHPGYLLLREPTLTCLEGAMLPYWDNPLPYCIVDTGECLRVIHNGTGTLTIPIYHEGLKYYLQGLRCRWAFDLPANSTVRVTLYYISMSKADDLLLYDGIDADSPLLKNITSIPYYDRDGTTCDSSGNRFFILFNANSYYTDRGFSISYRVIRVARQNGSPLIFPDPGTPMFGWRQSTITNNTIIEGDVVTYGCMYGYNMTGSRILVTNTTTEDWSDPAPTCTGSYSYNVTLTTGKSVDMFSPNFPHYYEKERFGKYYIFAPSGKGVQIEGIRFKFTAWSDNIQVVDESLNQTIASQYYQKPWVNHLDYNSVPKYIFQSMSNRVSITFKSTHYGGGGFYWMRLKVFDLPAYCLAPHDPQYGKVTGDDYREGAAIHYHCNPGYYMTGEATATCLFGNSRMWSSPAPKCIAPCGVHLDSDDGTVLSPGYPSGQTYEMSCNFTVVVTFGKVIVLHFIDFELQYNARHYNEYVQIWDAANFNATSIFYKTGMHSGLTMQLTTNSLLLRFTNNRREYGVPFGKGFHMTYYAYKPFPCTLPLKTKYMSDMTTEKRNETYVLTFVCEPGYLITGERQVVCLENGTYNVALPTCEAPCGGKITPLFNHGLIISPDYPAYYVNNETCIWEITANKFGFGFQLNFSGVDIPDGDELLIYDGFLESSVPVLWNTSSGDLFNGSSYVVTVELRTTNASIGGSFKVGYLLSLPLVSCLYSKVNLPHGYQILPPYWTPVGNRSRLRCYTGYTESGNDSLTCYRSRTWESLRYSCSCHETYTTLTGSLTQLKTLFHSYDNDMDCVYIIKVPGEYVVQIHFISFQTRPNDYLLVYDGLNDTSPLLARLEGYSLPPDVWSSSNNLRLEFHSDDQDVTTKYVASYKAYLPCLNPITNDSSDNFSFGEMFVLLSCDQDSNITVTCIEGGDQQLVWNRPVPQCRTENTTTKEHIEVTVPQIKSTTTENTVSIVKSTSTEDPSKRVSPTADQSTAEPTTADASTSAMRPDVKTTVETNKFGNKERNVQGNSDVGVIVPAVVVPLVIIGVIAAAIGVFYFRKKGLLFGRQKSGSNVFVNLDNMNAD